LPYQTTYLQSFEHKKRLSPAKIDILNLKVKTNQGASSSRNNIYSFFLESITGHFMDIVVEGDE
jgi:hypothetical protein